MHGVPREDRSREATLEATQNSTSVARKINFPLVEPSTTQTSLPTVDDDVDMIESSQSSDSNDPKHRSKRRKKGLESSVTKPASTRPSMLLFIQEHT